MLRHALCISVFVALTLLAAAQEPKPRLTALQQQQLFQRSAKMIKAVKQRIAGRPQNAGARLVAGSGRRSFPAWLQRDQPARFRCDAADGILPRRQIVRQVQRARQGIDHPEGGRCRRAMVLAWRQQSRRSRGHGSTAIGANRNPPAAAPDCSRILTSTAFGQAVACGHRQTPAPARFQPIQPFDAMFDNQPLVEVQCETAWKPWARVFHGENTVTDRLAVHGEFRFGSRGSGCNISGSSTVHQLLPVL